MANVRPQILSWFASSGTFSGRPQTSPGTRMAFALLVGLTCFPAVTHASSAWPQFRGHNASGIAESATPPVHFSATSNLSWKTALPKGMSSPCLWSNHLFLTAFDNTRIETIALDARDGRVLWRRTAPAECIEPFHRTECSPATPTPATDGRSVFVYFGSFGLLAYDFDGQELWKVPLPIPVQSGDYGSAVSPIVASGRVLLKRDQLSDSCLLAFDAASGKEMWRADRTPFKYGYSTPIIWDDGQSSLVVVPGMHQMKAYDLNTGSERWTLRGLPGGPNTTPVLGNGLLFFAGLSPTVRDLRLGSFESLLEKFDTNKDAFLGSKEGDAELKSFFPLLDLNRDGRVAGEEFHTFIDTVAKGKSSLMAIRPGGSGDITATHIVWQETRGLPYTASPLLYRNRVYLVRDGGMVSCFAADTGKAIFIQERLGALGAYYASPVAADGRIYFCSTLGTVTVLKAGDAFEVLSRNDLRERIAATPALSGVRLFVRTDNHLYAFSQGASHR